MPITQNSHAHTPDALEEGCLADFTVDHATILPKYLNRFDGGVSI